LPAIGPYLASQDANLATLATLTDAIAGKSDRLPLAPTENGVVS